MAKKTKKTSDQSTQESPQRPRSKTPGGKGAWKLMNRGSSVVAGLLAREVSTLTWRAATGRKPPTASRHPEADAREAVAWAVVGGALVELVKVVVQRWTATYWVRSTGELPPGMKPLKTKQKDSGQAGEPTPAPSAGAARGGTSGRKRFGKKGRQKSR